MTMLMSQQIMLPPIPRPPHDPTSWLLDARTGWRAAKLKDIEQLPPQQSLALALAPESRRLLTEANGSFGGLIVPANVALGADGSIYLLDTKEAQLKRFDPCECVFQKVPCFGGRGKGVRQLNDPHGIGICSGNLFVCDTGNRRLSVFALHGFALRGHWEPPPAAYQLPNPQLSNQWEPYDVAFDRHGRVYVTDGANGCIHRFSASGQWELRLAGFGVVTWIAIDCRDRLFVVVEGTEPSVRIVNQDGSSAIVASSPEELTPLFPRPPFEVDAEGLLHLGALCVPSLECECEEEKSPGPKCPPNLPLERGLFDKDGIAVSRCSTPPGPAYLPEGIYYSTALDSELYRCQWHRVILRGEIPAGARVVVETFSAEALLTDDQVQNLTADDWETNQTAAEIEKGAWDCLVRSGGGRFLWLKLVFRGNGKVTPRVESIELEFPRISLRRYLPAVFGEEPVSADFTDRFLALFDTTFRSIETKLDQLARYFDPLSAPAERDPKTGIDFLSWLASWIGLTLDRSWPLEKRRKFLKQAGQLYNLRGTREGLWRELVLFLEMETNDCCTVNEPQERCCPAPANCETPKPPVCAWKPPPLILEHFKLRRWLFLGAGGLGDQAVLWGKRIVNRSQLDANAEVGRTRLLTTQDPFRDPFHVYAHKFTVFVPACYGRSEQHRRALENLLRASRPASTLSQIEYVEPRFRIGYQSMIGFDSVIGRYPSGVTLNETPLGRASVLTAPPHKEGGASLEIGNQSRIGTTTKLE